MHKNQSKESKKVLTQKPNPRQAAAEVINNLGVKDDCKGYNYLLTAVVEGLKSKTTA